MVKKLILVNKKVMLGHTKNQNEPAGTTVGYLTHNHTQQEQNYHITLVWNQKS